MPRLRVHAFSISLDGYGAGPGQDLANPQGVGGLANHEWAFATRTFRQMFGREGGSTGVDDELAMRGFADIGAWIIGRNMFGPVRGPWQVLGPTAPGKGGGATTRPIAAPSSCSPIIRVPRSRWRAAPPSTSSPTACTRR